MRLPEPWHDTMHENLSLIQNSEILNPCSSVPSAFIRGLFLGEYLHV